METSNKFMHQILWLWLWHGFVNKAQFFGICCHHVIKLKRKIFAHKSHLLWINTTGKECAISSTFACCQCCSECDYKKFFHFNILYSFFRESSLIFDVFMKYLIFLHDPGKFVSWTVFCKWNNNFGIFFVLLLLSFSLSLSISLSVSVCVCVIIIIVF